MRTKIEPTPDNPLSPLAAQVEQLSARWCPLCGTQHAVAKGAPSPWTPHVTRIQIEALPALVAALRSLLELCEGNAGNALQRMDQARAVLASVEGGVK